MTIFKLTLLAVGISSSLYTASVFAGACDVNVEATATMAFNVKEISVPKTCKEITVNLKNNGTMAKSADMHAVITDGIDAGLDNNYVKKNDARVVGHTAVIGGGESTSAKIKLTNLKASESYMFFCSFPGHGAVMKGTFKLI